MTVRVGIAAPKASIAELRAVACCAAHCPDAPRAPMRAKRCCFVDSGASDPVSTAVVPSLDRPAATPIALAAPVPPPPARSVPVVEIARRAGPPPLLGTLRLLC
jgi:hypothetical protein